MVQSLWKIVWRFFKKIKTKPSYDPAVTRLMFIQKNRNKDLEEILALP